MEASGYEKQVTNNETYKQVTNNGTITANTSIKDNIFNFFYYRGIRLPKKRGLYSINE